MKPPFFYSFFIQEAPFSKFVSDLVDVRVNAVGNNAPLGDRAKFAMNSAIGRFGLNLLKHR